MAIVFQDKKIERVPLEKDGTTFWFEITPGLQRQVALNQMFMPGSDFGGYMNEVFRKALVAWDNLQTPDGALVEYKPETRDKVVTTEGIFDFNDVLTVFGLDLEANTPAPVEKKSSTSTKHSRKQLPTAGGQKNAQGANT